MCHIFVSWLHPYKEHRFIIIGSNGMISFEDSAKNKPLIYYDKKIHWVNGEAIPLSGESEIIKYDNSLALENQLKYFIDSLNKSDIKFISGDDAVEVIKILDMANATLMDNN